MAVDSIRTQLEKERPISPTLDHPEVVEALRHGNIYEILKTSGVHRKEVEDYLATQSRIFQNQIRQDYQVYASEGSLPPPTPEKYSPVGVKAMSLSAEDHNLFKQDMQEMRAMRARATVTEGSGQDVMKMGEKTLSQWNDFYSELQTKVIDMQMMQELRSKSADLNKEVQRMIALVMSGQIDPEYVLIAAAKSSLLQEGTIFSWKGKKVMHLNTEMDKISKNLLKMDPNDKGYMKELQSVQSKTRSGGVQLQLETMDLQKASSQIATTLDWVSNAIRTIGQAKQSMIQATTAR